MNISYKRVVSGYIMESSPRMLNINKIQEEIEDLQKPNVITPKWIKIKYYIINSDGTAAVTEEPSSMEASPWKDPHG